eukprot:sb/3465004/
MEGNYIPRSDTSSSLVSSYNIRARNGRQSRGAGQYTDMDGSDSVLSDSDSFQGDENYQNGCHDSEDSDDYDIADVLVQTEPIRTQSRLIQAEEKYIRTEIELQERYGANVQPPKYVAPKPAVTIKVVAVPSTLKFMCKCLVVFPTEEQLHEHIRAVHPVMAFKCVACPMSFDTSTALDEHLYTHISVQPYRCKICQQGFSVRKNLIRHEKHPTNSCRNIAEAASKVKDFKCIACPKSFDTRSDLDAHVLYTHIGVKPFRCKICQQGFSNRNNLTGHKRNPPKSCRRFTEPGIKRRRNTVLYTGVRRKRAKLGKSEETGTNCTAPMYTVKEGSGSWVFKRCQPNNQSSCAEEPAAQFDDTRSVPTQTSETSSKEVQVDIEESSSNFVAAPISSDLHNNRKFLFSLTNYDECPFLKCIHNIFSC